MIIFISHITKIREDIFDFITSLSIGEIMRYNIVICKQLN